MTRPSATTWTDGVRSAETTTTVAVDPVAVWYSDGARDVITGAPRVIDARLCLVSEVRLQGSLTGSTNATGDRFSYDGFTWEVQLTRKWEFADLYYAEAGKIS